MELATFFMKVLKAALKHEREFQKVIIVHATNDGINTYEPRDIYTNASGDIVILVE